MNMTEMSEIKELVLEQGKAIEEFKKQYEIRANRPPAGGGGINSRVGQDREMESDTPLFAIDQQNNRVPILTKGMRLSDLPQFKQEGDEPLSLTKTVKGLVTGSWKGAERERKAMSEGTGSLGGFFVSEQISAQVLDLARAASVCFKAGALTVPMESAELTVVKISADPTAFWRGENQEITESDATFEPIHLKALALGCLVRVSVELLEDAQTFSNTLESAMGKALALELDRAGLLGTGSGEPRGIYSHPDINSRSLGTNGGVLRYSDFSYAVQDILTANGTPNAVIYSPRTWAQIDRWIDGMGNPLQQPESYRALEKFTTTKISDAMEQGSSEEASMAIIGDFRQLMFGTRTQLILEASRTGGDSTFAKMQALIRGYLRADVAVLRPNHFSRIVGIIPEDE